MDGDGRWLADAIVAGSLNVVHDGSYMMKVSPKVCSSVLLIMRIRYEYDHCHCHCDVICHNPSV